MDFQIGSTNKNTLTTLKFHFIKLQNQIPDFKGKKKKKPRHFLNTDQTKIKNFKGILCAEEFEGRYLCQLCH